MAAKLLHSLADENPEIGVFQIFDGNHVLTGKRITHKRLSPGNSNFSNGSVERQSNNTRHQQTLAEMNLNKGANEKHRLSKESLRASFSSACSSPASSVDFDKTTPQEVSSYATKIYHESSSRYPIMNQSRTSPRLGRHALDLRDVVKDSMYGEARGRSVKTISKEEATDHGVKHRDSPRPLQISKNAEGYNGVRVSEQQKTSVDLKESLRVLAKMREAPWYYNDSREQAISLYESKDASRNSMSKDAPRFSYDGREISRLSFESQDAFDSNVELKELPRLSLDSREGSIRVFNFDSKSSHVSRISKSSAISSEKDHSLPQSSGTQKRPNVVAKLMGLDALPDSTMACDGESGLIRTFPVQEGESGTKPLKVNTVNRIARTPNSPRSSLKQPTSPQWRNPDLVMKPISNSRFPIEPAPWKVQDGNIDYVRTNPRAAKVPPRTGDSLPSVCSEFEKRLNDLEFKQPGKDLSALKQILEAMKAKGLLETSREEQASNFGTQGDNELRQRNQQCNHTNASTIRGLSSVRAFESPIVIMKPAKLVEKSGTSSSLVFADALYDIYKPHNVGAEDGKKGLMNSRTAKDQSPKYSLVDRKGNSKNTKSGHSSSRSHQLQTDKTTSNSAKSSGSSVSPRLQQKKLEMEKRSHPPTAPTSSSKPRRQTNRQPMDSGSPGGRSRPIYLTNPNPYDDQLSEISNESKSLSCHGDDMSVHSDGNAVQSVELNCSSVGLSMKGGYNLALNSLQKFQKATPRLEDDLPFAEFAMVASEHHSPVSILDASAYKDDEPSLVRQIITLPKVVAARDSNVNQGVDLTKPADNLANTAASVLTSEINRKKLENIENLVQKLRRLNSSHDEARTDYIASLCENTNPDHRYVSEILLASGLLLRDLSSGLAMLQLHTSGHPINPELFFVLEQTKQSRQECSSEKKPSDMEKLHRKLIFDAVNEALVGKMALVSDSREPWLRTEKLTRKTLNAQKLLKELCREIEQFQTKKPEFGSGAEVYGDVMRLSERCWGFSGEFSGVVLDIERSIFKDLVDEVVRGEAANLQGKAGRRRKLFAK